MGSKKRRSPPPRPAPVKAVYTIGELASMCGLSRWVVRRLIDRNGVRLMRAGRTILVPVAGIRDALPDLWDSILEVDAGEIDPGVFE